MCVGMQRVGLGWVTLVGRMASTPCGCWWCGTLNSQGSDRYHRFRSLESPNIQGFAFLRGEHMSTLKGGLPKGCWRLLALVLALLQVYPLAYGAAKSLALPRRIAA